MKRIIYLLFAVVLSCMLCFPAMAGEETPEYVFWDIRADTHSRELSIADMIALGYTPDEAAFVASLLNGENLDSWRIDPAVHAVGWWVNEDILYSLAENEDVAAILSGMEPVIYVPVWGTKNNTERIIGCCVISYDANEEDCCRCDFELWGAFEDDAFWEGEPVNFLDKVDAFRNFEHVAEHVPGCDLSTVTLLTVQGYGGKYSIHVLLLETDQGLRIYDCDNAAFLPEGELRPITTLSEFADNRAAFQESNSMQLSDIIYTFQSIHMIVLQNLSGAAWILVGVCIVIVLGIGGLIGVRAWNRRKQK